MNKIIKFKYIYFLLPLTYFFVSFAISLNYYLIGDMKKVNKTIISTFIFTLVFVILWSIIMSSLGYDYILDSIFGLFYIYTVSTIFSIYLIKCQKDYIEKIKHDK